MPYLTTYTLGCKVNRYETEYLAAALDRLGYVETPPRQAADLVIVNTCTVTADSDAKSRKAIRRLAKEHPHAEIVVMGCYATADPDAVASEPNVSEVLVDKAEIPAFLMRRGLPNPPRGLDRFGQRHRAFLKVQDGCQSRCAYCIIPSVRSRMSSRPVADVVDEVETLVAAGFREIVLTGIHLGHYAAQGVGKTDRLHDLVRVVAGIDGDFRLRISSLEASEVTDTLLDVMRQYPHKICRHLHLSLQSGSDAVLKAMRRPHLSGPFFERCEIIKRQLPNIALTTDLIVGFPGEAEADFQASCEAVRHVGFSKVHVFRFSPRRGTEAATLPHPVSHAVKQERAAALIALADRVRNDYAAAQVGHRVQVLPEEVPPLDPGTLEGTADIYLPVRVAAPPERIGQLLDVTVTRANGELLFGKMH